MRLYRRSPFHPTLGARLARLLGRVTAHLPSPQVRVVDGIRWELDLREVIDASLFFSGSFEPRAERVIAAHLRPGMTAIDIGANVGYHALRMARHVGAAGHVVAVEPAPGAAARLRRNLALNDFVNVAIVAAALGDTDAEEAGLQLQSSYPLSGRGGPQRVLTRVARLDSLVVERQLGRVDFIKMDVDGQEARVLRGAVETLRRFRPPLLFELTPSAVESDGESVEELFGSLLRLDYSVSDEGGTRWDQPLEQARRLRRGEGRNLVALPSAEPGRLPSRP
jgi:FkbM family methyltransferase